MIRLSGPEAHAHVQNLPRRLGPVRLNLVLGELPALALRFDRPRSYTGEDVLELFAAGNPDLLERIVEHFMALGVRRAEAGEFTARAYFNGKLSLAEAEGVAQAIAAESDAQLAAAKQLLGGQLGRLARRLADETATLLALVEAGVDFAEEEDVVAITPAALLERAQPIREALAAQLSRAVGVERLSETPWVVLLGPTNAGKSTLFNALLGRRRAVESQIAGATRDVLVEPLRLPSSGEVMLVDLAGVGDDVSALMRQASEARAAALTRAELIVECTAADAPQEEMQWWQAAAERAAAPEAPRLVVRTKSDLMPNPETTRRDLTSRDREEAGPTAAPGPSAGHAPPLNADESAHAEAIAVSARTGNGLNDLLRAIDAQLQDRASSLSAEALALAPRQEEALRRAEAAIARAIELVEARADERALADDELVAGELRACLDALGEIVGNVTPDDVLGRVFATFCVGK